MRKLRKTQDGRYKILMIHDVREIISLADCLT